MTADLSLHHPMHRAIWGQCLGDSFAQYLRKKEPQETWKQAKQLRQLPYKRGQLSIYAKQMLQLVKVRQRYPTMTPVPFCDLAKTELSKLRGHSLLCRAIHDNRPFDLPDIEMAVRIGPISVLFTDAYEMLEVTYPLCKMLSTHPHSIVGTLIFSMHCWNDAQINPMSTEDIFHFVRNWATKTDVPSETWWEFEQSSRILQQGYPLKEMMDFVNNLLQLPLDTSPSPRQSLSVIPIIIQRSDQGFDWDNIINVNADLEILMALKGCLMGIRNEIPSWLAQSLSHLKILEGFPIQQVKEEERQLRLF